MGKDQLLFLPQYSDIFAIRIDVEIDLGLNGCSEQRFMLSILT